MFSHLLVALDGSEPAQRALARTIEMAKLTGATLRAVSVVEDLPHVVSRSQEIAEDIDEGTIHFRRIQDDARARARRSDVELGVEILRGQKTKTLVEAASANETDLLVVGSAGHSGPFARFLGGTTAQLVAHAPTSVLVVRPRDSGRRFKQILVAVDGSTNSRTAVDVAVQMAQSFSGTLRALFVAAPGTDMSAVEQVRTFVAGAGVENALVVTRGHPVGAILEFADDLDADLIILGAVGLDHRRPVEIGGTSHRVADHSQRSVLVVR